MLWDYIQRVPANFLTQFLIHRYIEITSLLVAAIVNEISAVNSHIIIGTVALIQLASLQISNEGYTKIVPYLRVIYLDNRIVSYYLVFNSTIPLLIYFIFFVVVVDRPQTMDNIFSMSILLFNNTLFANFLHVFSFSLKRSIAYFPLIGGIYLIMFLQVAFPVIITLTVVATILFIVKIRNY